MGKRKDDSFDSESVGETAHKKHKKHKKHKHKKRHLVTESDEGEDVLVDQASPPPIKLKIKIGGQTLGTTSVPSVSETSVATTPIKQEIKWREVKSDVFKTKKAGDDTSDEEQAWLDALEKGDLDDLGGVKKCKDPLLMTARQRALLHGKPEESLLELPSGYKPADGAGPGGELTEEQITRRQQKAKKRKEQAHQKTEKDKKQTLERLLKKQDSKIKGGSGKGRSRKTQIPGFRYLNRPSGITISVPHGCHMPFSAQTAKQPKPAEMCGVAGCPNTKKYSCSKTGVSLCSLECYRKNMAATQRPV